MKQKAKNMFQTTASVTLIAIAVASPAFARFEDEATYQLGMSDYITTDIPLQNEVVCSVAVIDTIDTQESVSTKASEPSLLTVLTGVEETTAFESSFVQLACK